MRCAPAISAKTPAALTVIGESQAGRRFGGAVGPGEAVRIFTGAALPEGADTVVIQENAERQGDTVIVREAPARPGANVRKAGGDFRAGQALLAAGRRLDAASIMLAAAGGHAELKVAASPRVAILATGDELVAPGKSLGPDQIVSSNPYGLAALVERAGGVPQIVGIAADSHQDLAAKLQSAAGADILVTIGGASVGDRDLVRPVLEAAGMRLDFWKVAIRPGKPMLFGQLGPTRVLGLPGNPVSCMLSARVFLVPLLYRLLGRSDSALQTTSAVLADGLSANGERQHYMLARLEPGPGGTPRVTALASQDSGYISGLVAADVLIVRPPNAPPEPAGAIVEILALDL